MKAKLKAAGRKAAHVLLSREALLIEAPLLKKVLLRYGFTAATAGAFVAELVSHLIGK